MILDLTLDQFLFRNRIQRDAWEATTLEWPSLQRIGVHHEAQADHLRESAELFARVIQKFDRIHSVRWRVKDAEHLLEKIVRKRIEKSSKYEALNEENYQEHITDLVGIRAIHLFKDDCFYIDELIRKTWEPTETPIAYIREGDPEDTSSKFRSHGFDVKQHPAGYRSIHYVVGTQPLRKRLNTEIQVRTIFEEGWSEIDHQIKYPNFSSNTLSNYFLLILNRMAGSADEMGTFVKELSLTLTQQSAKIAAANAQRDEALQAVDKTASELYQLKIKDASANEIIAKLRREIEELRKTQTISSPFSLGGKGNFLSPLSGLGLGGDEVVGVRNAAGVVQIDGGAGSLLKKLFSDVDTKRGIGE